MKQTYYDANENFIEYLFRVDELYRLKNKKYKELWDKMYEVEYRSEKVKALIDEREVSALTKEEAEILVEFLNYRDEQISMLMKLMFREGMREIRRIFIDE